MRIAQRQFSCDRCLPVAVLTLAMLLLNSQALFAQGSVEEGVRAAVEGYYAGMREDKVDARDRISAQGALQFWSSGGLMIEIQGGSSGTEYEQINLHPKHITVVPLTDDSAAVLYYLEGSMQPKGRPMVSRYLTRVTEAYVREDGAWKARVGHWSALQGGGGTNAPTD